MQLHHEYYMRIFDNSLTPVEPKMPDFKVSTEYIVDPNIVHLAICGCEDEYFWKTAKEREQEQEKPENMYKSQDGRYSDPQ